MQNYYNVMYREEEREMLPYCADQGIAVIPWSPLARGKLTRDFDESTTRQELDEVGKRMFAGLGDADRAIIERVRELAERHDVPRAQVALAWLLGKSVVTAPIVGASKPHHLEDAVAALELSLSADEVSWLEEGYVPHPILGHA
jgi:aryl-alcohol dehydrogenase-like predicted oxidoreductase